MYQIVQFLDWKTKTPNTYRISFFFTNNYRAMDIIIPTITGGTYPLLVTITIATIVRWG